MIAARRIGFFIVLAAVWLTPVRDEAQTATLAVQGSHFTVNGTARFLAFVAYFDAMRATDARLDSDLAYFKSKGFDGVRVFPNWWRSGNGTGCRLYASDTLMDRRGALRPGRLNALKHVLDKANGKGLVVDLSFAPETVEGLGDSEYQTGLANTARELKGYRNVLFDLMNEYTGNGCRTSRAVSVVAALGQAVKSQDPDRIVTASRGPGEREAGHDAAIASLDAVAYHDPRTPDWYVRTTDIVVALKQATSKPIYLQEPSKYPGDSDAAHFLEAAARAKRACAAAWTFHTSAGYDLSSAGARTRLTPPETAVVDGLLAALNAAPVCR